MTNKKPNGGGKQTLITKEERRADELATHLLGGDEDTEPLPTHNQWDICKSDHCESVQHRVMGQLSTPLQN
jgi:hypothetical protein